MLVVVVVVVVVGVVLFLDGAGCATKTLVQHIAHSMLAGASHTAVFTTRPKSPLKRLSGAMAAPSAAGGKANSAATPVGDNAAKLAAAKAGGSDAKPANTGLPLAELNVRSAAFASWEVQVYNAKMRKYTYVWEGKQRQGANFTCMLVSTADPTQYCLGEAKPNKGGDQTPLQQAAAKFKDDLTFTLSKVALFKDAKKQYINTSVEHVIDLRATNASPVLQTASLRHCQPAPPNDVAQAVHITTGQQFDITAFIRSVSAVRAGGALGGQPRVIADCELVDGSTLESGKMAILPLSVFANKSTQEPELFQHLRAAQSQRQPISFFKLNGCKDQVAHTFIFSTSQDFHWTLARSAKATRLLSDASAILDNDDTESLPKSALQSRTDMKDYSNEPGIETTCFLFNSITQTTQVKKIESGETLWQINWVRIEEPSPGTNLRTNDGQRLWFRTTIKDVSGPLTLYIREQAAFPCRARQALRSSSRHFKMATSGSHKWLA